MNKWKSMNSKLFLNLQNIRQFECLIIKLSQVLEIKALWNIIRYVLQLQMTNFLQTFTCSNLLTRQSEKSSKSPPFLPKNNTVPTSYPFEAQFFFDTFHERFSTLFREGTKLPPTALLQNHRRVFWRLFFDATSWNFSSLRFGNRANLLFFRYPDSIKERVTRKTYSLSKLSFWAGARSILKVEINALSSQLIPQS